MHMLMVHYISNVINVYKRNFDVFYCKKVEIRPQTYVNFLKAFQSMTLYGTWYKQLFSALVDAVLLWSSRPGLPSQSYSSC